MGHDLDNLQGQRSKSDAKIKETQGTISHSDSHTHLTHDSSVIQAKVFSSLVETEAVDNAPTIIVPKEASSIIVVAPDGSEAEHSIVSGMFSEAYEHTVPEVSIQISSNPTERTIHTSTSKGYKHLTMKEKYELCKFHAENPGCSLDAVIDHFEPIFGRRVPKSTLIYTLKTNALECGSDDIGDPLSRLSQNQKDPSQLATPSTSQAESPMPDFRYLKRYSAPRQYKSLTLKQKYDLCAWHEENPRCGLDEIIDHFEPLFGWRVSKSTLNHILKESSVYLSMDPDSPSTWTRKHKGAKEVKLFEDLLYNWVCEQLQLGGIVTRRAVGDKAIQLANECSYTEFLYSPMWVQVFLKRFQLLDKVHYEN